MTTNKFNKWDIVYTYYDLAPYTIEFSYKKEHPQKKTLDYYYLAFNQRGIESIMHEDVFLSEEQRKEKHNNEILKKIKSIEEELERERLKLL